MKKNISIIGSGPSALILAAHLDPASFHVTIFEKNFAPGRKFLVAGDGGFNLTHAEPITQMAARYTPQGFMGQALHQFNNMALREWLRTIHIETYEGSSKRVFPLKGIKPIAVLNAILAVLKKKGVELKTLHEWKGWNDNGALLFTHKETEIAIETDITVFALGGGSWAKTGSDGAWVPHFTKRNITTLPFQASNCACHIQWDPSFLEKAEGRPLKNIAVSAGQQEQKGELVITAKGLEGGALYALSPTIRHELSTKGKAEIYIDLKPQLSLLDIMALMTKVNQRSISEKLARDIKLSSFQIALLKSVLTKTEFMQHRAVAESIKHLKLTIDSLGPIDEAISTVGGIATSETDENFQLKKLPHHYAIGEMLDWDAPTGGYLLQGCFSMGKFLADHLNS